MQIQQNWHFRGPAPNCPIFVRIHQAMVCPSLPWIGGQRDDREKKSGEKGPLPRTSRTRVVAVIFFQCTGFLKQTLHFHYKG